MSEFGELEKKAETYVQEHPEQADKPVDEVAGVAERGRPVTLRAHLFCCWVTLVGAGSVDHRLCLNP